MPRLVPTAAGHPRLVPILVVLVALVAMAVLCSYALRNTSGARGTNQPGAMAGNLALVFMIAVVAGVALLALVGATR